MVVCVYEGDYHLVSKSGVGKAIEHQKAALRAAGVTLTDKLPPAGPQAKQCIVHFNTVMPKSVFAAACARARGCRIVYYGHSTMEDFKNSFFGSNLVAPLFKKWIVFCYNHGDVIITPSEYSRRILSGPGYAIKKPIIPLTNGIDTAFFAPSAERAARFRARYQLREGEKCVISVGHWMVRKGLPDYVELARSMPQVRFLWFGHTDDALLTPEIRAAMRSAPQNLTFAGFAEPEQLCDAYCGTDAFVFMSHEETEGIVILEALACGAPTIVRDIPVYDGWLEDGKSVYKAKTQEQFVALTQGLLAGSLPALREGGHAVADARSLRAVGQRLCEIYRQSGFVHTAAGHKKQPQ